MEAEGGTSKFACPIKRLICSAYEDCSFIARAIQHDLCMMPNVSYNFQSNKNEDTI